MYLDGTDATLLDNLVEENASGSGGGIYLNWSPALLTGNTVQRNEAADDGGGLAAYASDAMIEENWFLENTAGRWGGGLHLYFGSDAQLVGNLVISNSANSRGGGLYFDTSSPLLTNTVIADNSLHVLAYGAGIYTYKSHPRIWHATIARNGAGSDIGIRLSSGSDIALTNTILVSHTWAIHAEAGTTAMVNGVLWYGNVVTNTTGDGTIIVTNDVTGPPAFAGDGYHLTEGSAAIGQGVSSGVTVDIDGELRPLSQCDLGADEIGPASMIYLPWVLRAASD